MSEHDLFGKPVPTFPDHALSAPMQSSVYLAGPGVFRADASEYGAKLRQTCKAHGLIGLWPLDNEIAGSAPVEIAAAIYHANCAMIDRADAVVADLSPFRGPHMDVGTAFEIGYAVARDKPVYGYGSPKEMIERVRCVETDGQHWDTDGLSVENFGLTENLMIAVPLAGTFPDAEAAIAAAARALIGEAR